uniref:RING-type domain-containing protein n=1 Tax=Panagrolaimus superbus TaxID=310955 RepID=A0A914YRZ0_9BILA
MERDKIKKCQKLPFQICPILNIRGVNQEGIYYIGDRGREYCIKWPTDSLWKKKEFQKWLHEILIRTSDRYRNIADREVLEKLTREEEDISEKLFKKRNPILARTGTLLQWFRFSRTMNIDLEIFGINDCPVSARLIATFRLHYTRNPKIVDETMQRMTAENGEICAICLYKFDLNERYEIWPGTSTAQHLFHYDCILEQFRTDFKCPLCREPASFI